MNDEYKTRLGHRERVRTKLATGKAENMSDIELLEAYLFGVLPRVDTNSLARRLVARFGSIDKVFDSSYKRLLEVDGVGEAVAAQIVMLPELVKRYRSGKTQKEETFGRWSDVSDFLRPRLDSQTSEEVHIMFLDAAYKLIRHAKLEEGIEDKVHIYNRKICRMAIEEKASHLVLAHNHPGCDIPVPSERDDEMTFDLYKSLRALDIQFIDHIIVGTSGVFSYYRADQFKKMFQKVYNVKFNSSLANELAEFDYEE